MRLESHEIRSLLAGWSQGQQQALDQLIPLVFEDLHQMAQRVFARESDHHTLQPTALVNEVYFKLRNQKTVYFDSIADFFGFAAGAMRHLLVDYARQKKAAKRGGEESPVTLDTNIERLLSSKSLVNAQLIDLHTALEGLSKLDPRQAKIVELRYFLGLRVEEVAQILEISESTVKREWRTAKLWLQRELSGSGRARTAAPRPA